MRRDATATKGDAGTRQCRCGHRNASLPKNLSSLARIAALAYFPPPPSQKAMGFLNTVSNLLKKAFPWLKNKPIISTANTEEGHNEHVQPDAAEGLSAIPPRQGMNIPLIRYSMWTTITSTGRLLLRPPVALAPGYTRLQGYFERRLESLGTRRVTLGV